tara:strand:- start:213 stop:563 length:351 start_codon:yes stop_codon:yes gene_type:complete
MSRITFTKKGNLSDTIDTTLPITNAPLFFRVLWNIGNVLGFNIIKRNAKKSRGFSIESKDTFTAFNFGKWVAYRSTSRPRNPLWFKRTLIDGKYQMTPISQTNTTMQMIRIPARLV